MCTSTSILLSVLISGYLTFEDAHFNQVIFLNMTLSNFKYSYYLPGLCILSPIVYIIMLILRSQRSRQFYLLVLRKNILKLLLFLSLIMITLSWVICTYYPGWLRQSVRFTIKVAVNNVKIFFFCRKMIIISLLSMN